MKERYWSFIVYPESAPEKWEDIITETGLKWCHSPIHDRDIWDEDSPQYVDEKGILHSEGEKYKKGDKKKAHYHCLLLFNGPTTYKRVCTLIKPLNCTIPKMIISPTGMIDYFTHKNDLDKAQYDLKDRVAFNGVDLDSFNDLSESEVDKVINQLLCLIHDNNIIEYSDFIDCVRENDNYNMLRVAKRYASFFSYYINSKRNKLKNKS